jgi:uncharacterized caspase-like protein
MTNKKALVVGINYYEHSGPLFGCVIDALAVQSVLDRNSDGTKNFATRLMAASSPTTAVTRRQLREAIQELFSGESDIALFYFAGHGYIESTGGYLIASDAQTGDGGVALSDVISFANSSQAKNRIIILDSCHSGVAGSSAISPVTAARRQLL